MFKNLTKAEKSWVLYDVGNSAFTMLACSLIPIWFKALAIGEGPGKITGDQATAYYSIAVAVVTVAVALLGPVLGAIADHKDKKKIFFTTTVSIGVIGCILNGFAAGWVAFIVIYVLSKIFYSASLTFYDSMLNDVTTEDRMDQVSSYGFAWGYIGSCIPFTVALIAYVLGPDAQMMGPVNEAGVRMGILPGNLSKIIGFAVTGIWWFLVSMPLIKNYRQINYVETGKARHQRRLQKNRPHPENHRAA